MDKAKADKKEEKKELTDKERLVEMTEMVKRVQADFENYKKRTDKEKEEFSKYACKKIILELLPIMDHFDLAIKHKENKEEFVKGMEMIYAQIYSMLEKEGVKAIKSEGEKFDPLKHEAMMQDKQEDREDDEIVEEFQKGYTLHDQVIRPSKVKVNKKEVNK